MSRRPSTWQREIYLGFVLDREVRARDGRGLLGRRHGDRGDRARAARDASSGSRSSPAVGMQAFQAREIAFGARPRARARSASGRRRILGCYRAFRDLDATMVEINPLVVTEEGDVAGARRQDELRRQRAVPPPADRRAARQERRRTRARPTPPTAACPMSGSTATSAASSTAPASPWRRMDMIKLAGGEPANFLDIGGGASPERVAKAFRLVLWTRTSRRSWSTSSPASTAATGSPRAWSRRSEELGVNVPLVVRLAGTNVEEGRAILADQRPDDDRAPTRSPKPPQKAVAAARQRTSKQPEGGRRPWPS